ncbi:MAG TPA: ATP-binding cassette domain-containing protein [Chloroflexota bacterium]|nr:ATP-binding cassette domain-containing protein [Chloroflexota bacterium]
MAIVVQDLEVIRPDGAMLFSGVSFHVADKEHAALIGVNGVGKTTLLRVLARELKPSQGSVQIDGGLQFMPQQIGRMYGNTTVRELLASVSPQPFRQHGLELIAAERDLAENPSDEAGVRLGDAIARWGEAGGYQQEAVWDRCTSHVLRQSLDQAADRLVSELSGGEQKRLALEMLLTSDSANLLLDEPDNFLDIVGKRWLEQMIETSPRTILMVSHDRELLARSTRKIVTLEGFGAWVHGNSFATYYEAREARQDRLEDALQRWNEEERRLFRHMRMMKQRAAISDANASQANAAETRWKKFVDLGPPQAPTRDQRIRMRLRGSESGRQVVACSALHLLAGSSSPLPRKGEGSGVGALVNPFDLLVRFGERVAIVGPNGTGKSHFVRLISGEPVAHQGTVTLGARIKVGAFNQMHEHPEWTGKTVIEILADADLTYARSMATLARYELQQCENQTFETLSGGQQARLQVLLLELGGANLLLLDEPTDNLDLDSAEALERALDEFTGTVIAVTHDRWFMRSLDRFIYFDRNGDVAEAPDLETILPVLGGEAAATSGARRLKPLSLNSAPR